MGLQTKMGSNKRAIRENAMLDMYKNDKHYRADKLIEAWSRVPEVGAGLKTMPRSVARNVAINLDRQYNFMSGLKESQMSAALNNFTPENMLRLVRLSMPNLVRNKIFTEFSLETTKDSIQYVRPFWSKTANGHDLNDRDATYGGREDDDYDPWNYSKGGDFNGDDFRKALYEDTRDRANQELANVPVKGSAVLKAGDNDVVALFRTLEDADGFGENAKFLSGKWGREGVNYVDGYTNIYGYNAGDSGESVEQQTIALQDKRSGKFFAAPGFKVELVSPVALRDKFMNNHESGITVMPGSDDVATQLAAGRGEMGLKITVDAEKAPAWFKAGETEIRVFGRFNSEGDLEGNYLGEVEVKLTDYQFKPSATSIGVSWSQLTELTLETSYGLTAEELLVSAASQEIRSSLDYRAIRLGYTVAKTNAGHNPNYYYVFDAAYNSGDGNTNPARGKDGYKDNAQTVISAFDAIGDVMFDEIKVSLAA